MSITKHGLAYFARTMETVNMHVEITFDTFENIFTENYQALYSYVNSILKDEDSAKDVISDLFLNLWQNKDVLQINHLKPYLFRSARNGALKAVNLQNKTVGLVDDLFNIPSDSYNPFERFATKQSIRIVKNLIGKLSNQRREMIELRLIGLKNYEIATTLDIPEKKVEYNMREAIEQLAHTISNSNIDRATIAGGLTFITLVFAIIG